MATVTNPPATAGGTITPNTRVFAGRPEAVGEARAWARSFAEGSPAADDVALMTSELFTNAIQHSGSGLPGGAIVVSVRTGKTWIRVDVFDQGELPASFEPPPGLGLGLGIISQLADMSGADGSDWWFSVRTGGAR
jgi:anti-sigma regulatory factor (Ser/Thr protein kinase)